MSDDVSVKFGADTKGVEDGAKRSAESIERLKGQIEGMSEGFKRLGEIVGISMTVDAIKEFVASMAELGEQFERTSAILGVSLQEVGEFKFIAEATGGTLDTMSLGMERLAFNMERAAAGSKAEQAAFTELGVSAKDGAGHLKSLDGMLNEVADAFSKHADGAEKTALAIQLFGRAGANMIPVLNQGRAGLQELRDQAQKTGDVLDEATVKGMAETQRHIVIMNASLQGLGATIFSYLKPIVDSVVDTFSHWFTGLRDAIEKNEEMRGALKGLAEGFALLEVGIDLAIFGLQELYEIGKATFVSLAQGFAATAATINDAVHLDWGAIGGEWQQAGEAIAGQWSASMDALAKASDDTMATIKAQFAAVDQIVSNTSQKLHVTIHPAGGALPAFTPIDQTKIEEVKKAIAEVQKTFEGVFSSIISGFDRAITGLVTRTMTWKQAFITVLGSIWQEFVKIVEQMLAKWLAAEATKTVATLTGVDARATAEVAGQATAGASMITNAIKVIFVDAQKTFAGVFGFLSGLMGPFAAGPAAAAGATVAAVAGALPSFAMGSWELPSDMVAQVHKGEMIVPAQQAESMRQGGGISDGDLDRLVNRLVPHFKALTTATRAGANSARTMQRNMDSRLRMLRGAT